MIKFYFIFTSVNCNLPPQQCIMEIPTQVSWYRARLLCESNQAHLAVTNASTFAYFNNKRVPGMGDLLYWTGLHRKQHMLWTLGMYSLIHCILVDSSTVIMLGKSICHFRGIGSILSLFFCFDGKSCYQM